MKHKLLFFGALFFVQMGFSQENTDSDNFGRNELKINAAYLLAEIFEISYERNLTRNSALGLSVMAPFRDDTDYSFMLNPYYRVFFGKKPAQGFFVEANSSFASLYDYDNQSYYNTTGGYYLYTSKKEKEFSFGLGIAVGGKFVLNDQFVVDVYGGLGRHFGNDYLPVYPRLGINLGYRFN